MMLRSFDGALDDYLAQVMEMEEVRGATAIAAE
jgi:hypothetical protein